MSGGIHRLRHSFCSRLAAAGALPGEIQKLAGHSTLTTTKKYMHVALSLTRLDAAIGLLDHASGLRPSLEKPWRKPAPKTPKPGKAGLS